ncbi:MAG: hypothetical protein AAFX10_00190 [Pseudomonadota bacterium]
MTKLSGSFTGLVGLLMFKKRQTRIYKVFFGALCETLSARSREVPDEVGRRLRKSSSGVRVRSATI